jgi:hypothetical protein
MSKWVDDEYGPYTPFFDNLEVMRETHLKKNSDYAGDGGTYFNFEYAAKVAEPFTDPVDKVFATMLGIKLARLAILKKPGKKPKNEPTLDTQKDLATYAAIWWTYMCEQEAKSVTGRRVRPGVRKRLSKTGRSGRSTSKRGVATAKATRRSNR